MNEILHKWGQQITEQLKNDIRSKPLTKYGVVNSSGKLADSIRYEVDERGLRIYAAHYVYQIVYGRQSGKFPPISAIEKWIDEKPIQADIPKKSLAFLIARKISREGTEIFKQGGTTLLSDIINAQAISSIKNDLANGFQSMIVSNIRSELLKIAA